MKKDNAKLNTSTALILEIFRLNGCLLETGNMLVAPVELTSAKWQVIGTLALNEKNMTVSQIAKDMRLTRQAIQRTVNKLIIEKLLELKENPYHKSAKLVAITEKGKKSFEQAMALYHPWVLKLMTDIPITKIHAALETIQLIRGRLSND